MGRKRGHRLPSRSRLHFSPCNPESFWILYDGLPQECDDMLNALDDLIRGTETDEDDPFAPLPAQPEVGAAAEKARCLRSRGNHRGLVESCGTFGRGDLGHVRDAHGPGIRLAECNMCHEHIDEETPTVTHEAWMNTSCILDWNSWVRHSPSCPSCRAPLMQPPISSLLRSRKGRISRVTERLAWKKVR